MKRDPLSGDLNKALINSWLLKCAHDALDTVLTLSFFNTMTIIQGRNNPLLQFLEYSTSACVLKTTEIINIRNFGETNTAKFLVNMLIVREISG